MPFRHQRADGGVSARFAAAPAGARPEVLAQSAPLRLLLPDAEPGECSIAALLNTGGGLAGGDAVRVALTLAPGARLTLATAAAEKVYRSLGPATRVENHLEAGDGAALEWIPQETILFDGASLQRRTEIALAATSRLLALEMLVFGRAAGGEVIRRLHLRDTWRLRRDGRLLWAEALRLDGPDRLADPLGFGGAGAMATLLLAGPGAESLLPTLRESLPDGVRAGATKPAPGLVLARFLGEAGAVRAAIAGILPMLRAELLGQPHTLPRLWTN
nr:urease accessory protein UreD [Roseococcus sp. MDT2-1-1]